MTQYEDPPGMPEDERMTPAELKVVREFLGLSTVQLAALLHVTDRTVRHWEDGRYQIPDGARREVEQIEARTGAYVGHLAGQLGGEPGRRLMTYPTDEAYRVADPHSPYPASWHRAVTARVALEVPGLAIDYPPDGSAARVIGSAAGIPTVALVALGPQGQAAGLGILDRLAAAGIGARAMPWDRSLKNQMLEAHRSAAPYAVVVGPREAESGRAQVKRMDGGAQAELDVEELSGYLAGAAR